MIIMLYKILHTVNNIMGKKRAFSNYSKSAALLLGKAIQLGRKERKFTAQELADRAGISRGTLASIEKGDMRCEIGLVFEVASLVGIKLFDADEVGITMSIDHINDKIALLPKSIYPTSKVVKDDF
jgi:DNA-binding XRE family transcriptional regulator